MRLEIIIYLFKNIDTHTSDCKMMSWSCSRNSSFFPNLIRISGKLSNNSASRGALK